MQYVEHTTTTKRTLNLGGDKDRPILISLSITANELDDAQVVCGALDAGIIHQLESMGFKLSKGKEGD